MASASQKYEKGEANASSFFYRGGGFKKRISMFYNVSIPKGREFLVDWNAIKTEYITTDTSYRKLADKYGVTYNNIGIVSRRENWRKLREEYNAKTVSKILAIESNKQAERMRRLLTVSDKLLEAVEDAVDKFQAGELLLDKAALKSLSGTIKDIKDIQSIKSELDIEEQKARIANLKRQAEADTIDTTVTVVFDDEMSKWSK